MAFRPVFSGRTCLRNRCEKPTISQWHVFVKIFFHEVQYDDDEANEGGRSRESAGKNKTNLGHLAMHEKGSTAVPESWRHNFLRRKRSCRLSGIKPGRRRKSFGAVIGMPTKSTEPQPQLTPTDDLFLRPDEGDRIAKAKRWLEQARDPASECNRDELERQRRMDRRGRG